jgi:hypothetical protein
VSALHTAINSATATTIATFENYNTTTTTAKSFKLQFYGNGAGGQKDLGGITIVPTDGNFGYSAMAFSVRGPFSSGNEAVAEVMRFTRSGTTPCVGIGTTGPGYTLDVNGDINALNSLRIGGLIQPRLMSSGTFTGVTSFDTVTFDLLNYNVAEIRMTVYFNTTNQRIMSSQLLDTGGTVFTATESGWQMFSSGTTAAASGTGAYIINNTETVNNGVGGFIVVIRLIGNMGLSGSTRNHWEWTTTGCYAGTGASTTYGRATPYNLSGTTFNRMRFNLSGGTMTGKYSIINYST